MFKDDNGRCHPFAGIVESYDKMRKLYMITEGVKIQMSLLTMKSHIF